MCSCTICHRVDVVWQPINLPYFHPRSVSIWMWSIHFEIPALLPFYQFIMCSLQFSYCITAIEMNPHSTAAHTQLASFIDNQSNFTGSHSISMHSDHLPISRAYFFRLNYLLSVHLFSCSCMFEFWTSIFDVVEMHDPAKRNEMKQIPKWNGFHSQFTNTKVAHEWHRAYLGRFIASQCIFNELKIKGNIFSSFLRFACSTSPTMTI